jgi:hypothetical protein
MMELCLHFPTRVHVMALIKHKYNFIIILVIIISESTVLCWPLSSSLILYTVGRIFLDKEIFRR